MSTPTASGGGSGPASVPDPTIPGITVSDLTIVLARAGQPLGCRANVTWGPLIGVGAAPTTSPTEDVTGLVLDGQLNVIATMTTAAVIPPADAPQPVQLASTTPLPSSLAGQTVYVVVGPLAVIEYDVSGNVYQGSFLDVLWAEVPVTGASSGGGSGSGSGSGTGAGSGSGSGSGGGSGSGSGSGSSSSGSTGRTGSPLPNPTVSGSGNLATDVIALGVALGLLYVLDRALFGRR